MRRLLIVCLAAALHVPAGAQPQTRRPQADGVVRLLADLEGALASGRMDAFAAIAGNTLPDEDRARFGQTIAPGEATSVAVRERSRRAVGSGFELLTEVLIGHGRSGRIATWRLVVEPRADNPDRFELTSLTELAAVDGLVRLTLDTARRFAIKDFTFEAPDLTMRIASGSAFVAESPGGVTAIVLRGRGGLSFAPKDAAEQGQLELFADQPEYQTEIESAFIRLNPGEFASRVREGSLVPDVFDASEARRAQAIFDDMSRRTYSLDLNDLGSERWSLEPGSGSLVIEFRSRRHGWLTYARSPSEPEDVSFFDRENGRNISVYASSEKLRRRGPDFSEDDDVAYDVEHYGLDLTFDPVRSWVSGRAAIRLRVRRDVLTTLTLRLAEPLTVSSVTSSEHGRLLTLRVIGQNNVIVSLPRPIRRDDVLGLEVAYNGRLEPQTLNREAIAVDGRIISQQSGEYTVLQPENRYLYSNRVFWYPQGEESDYATAEMRLTVPSEFQVVGSGTFVGSSMFEAPGDKPDEPRLLRTVEYAADRPARYLACVISRFVPIDQLQVQVPRVAPSQIVAGPDDAAVSAGPTGTPGAPLDVVNVEVVSTPRMTSRNRDMPSLVASILGFYAETIGEAPYPDFTLAGIDDNLPGGHSPAFFAVLHQPLPTSPYLWGSDPVAFDHIYRDFFLAHEVAHQWWGQAVGWKNYHEQWLSEGLAQYFAVLFAHREGGPELSGRLLEQMRRTSAPFTNQGPISLGYRVGHIQSQSRIFRAIIYNKSAVVLHMLRQLIGDEAFFAGLRDFYASWRFKKAGTSDLQAALQSHTTLPLERFVERWIRNAELPDLTVTSRIDNEKRVGLVRVRQNGPTFDVPLQVQIQYREGPEEFVQLAIGEADQEFTIPLRGEARRIQVKDEIVPGRVR